MVTGQYQLGKDQALRRNISAAWNTAKMRKCKDSFADRELAIYQHDSYLNLA